jgi:hypothetical protein
MTFCKLFGSSLEVTQGFQIRVLQTCLAQVSWQRLVQSVSVVLLRSVARKMSQSVFSPLYWIDKNMVCNTEQCVFLNELYTSKFHQKCPGVDVPVKSMTES